MGHVESGTESARATGGPGLDTVVPLVRADDADDDSGDSDDSGYRDDGRNHAHDHDGDASSPVVDVLAGSLIVLYAFDEGDRFRTVAQRDLARLGVDQATLAAAARSNLIDRLDDLELLERPDGCGMVRLDGNLEASVLLVSALWDDVAEILADEVVVAVPTADVVLFCGAGNHTARRALRIARDRALAVFDDRMTRDLFRFSGGSWHVEPR